MTASIASIAKTRTRPAIPMFAAIFSFLFALWIFALPFYIAQELAAGIAEAWAWWKSIRHSDSQRRSDPIKDAITRASERRREALENSQRRLALLLAEKRAAIESRRKESAARQAVDEQRRRNDARAECECRWSTCAPHIVHNYNRTDFDRFVRTFMTDAHAADEVETRSRQLLDILDAFYQQREVSETGSRFETLEDVTDWFIEQQERIGRLPLDEQTRDEHLARLNATYSELSERMLEIPQ